MAVRPVRQELKNLREHAHMMTAVQLRVGRLIARGWTISAIAKHLGNSPQWVIDVSAEVHAIMKTEPTKLERRSALHATMPDVESAAEVPTPVAVETCGYCGLHWHTENHPDGRPRCDLKLRRLSEAYIGSALGADL
jgi:hypothetical protein